MRLSRVRPLAIILSLAACAGAPEEPAPEDPEALDTVKGKASYAMGFNLGEKFQDEEVELDLELLARGIRDGYTGAPSTLTEEATVAAILTAQEEARRRKAAKNRRAGDELRARNAERPEVLTLDSGLQYEILEPGDGASPDPTDRVTVHYVGALADGDVFESTQDRGAPSTVPLDDVIAGWAEALPLMKVGARWRLWVPPELGWGEAGSPPSIGPDATLVFDIELLGIEPAE